MTAEPWRPQISHIMTDTTHPFLRPDPWAADRERARVEHLGGADVRAEHVLRGSKSFTARSFRSRPSAHSLRVPSSRSNNENLSIDTNASETLPQPGYTRIVPLATNTLQVLGEIAPNNQMLRTGPLLDKLRPSPTPSLKRKKAEAIVKAHGSPTHIRVTAGGRIVPSEQSPLCYPRYGYSAINLNGGLIKFAPNVQAGQPQWTKATENGFVAQDEHGNLSQIVNGAILPLHEVDGALRLYMPAPNLKISINGPQRNTSKPPTSTALEHHAGKQQDASQSNAVPVPEISVDAQIQALDVEYSKLERELKELNKAEVIHGRAMSRAAKEALFAQRRSLVAGLDKLRKGIKALKNQPPPNAPTSPRAMIGRHQMSPSRNRLPSFLQMQQASGMVAHHVHQSINYQTLPPPASFGSQYGIPAPTDESYAGHSWAVPPPGVFAPRSFDGSFSVYPQPNTAGLSLQPPIAPPVTESIVPQSDGARSLSDLPVASPHRSRAVSIKVPEVKPPTNVKSNLNPMSPVYKPGFGPSRNVIATEDRTAQSGQTSVGPTQSAPQQPSGGSNDNNLVATASPETTFNISPSKTSGHLRSSSISSFETADFFPTNPREYSTRQHDYPIRGSMSEDKTSRQQTQTSDSNEDLPITPEQDQNTDQGRFRATAAPPGTPVLDTQGRPSMPVKVDGYREEHNVSPKNKREWLFVAEDPSDPTNKALPSSSPMKGQPSLEAVKRIPSNNTLDFSQKPREWIEGFQAGLHRRSIGSDCNGKFIDGYCSGLLRSKPKGAGPASVAPSTGSPMKTISRRPSPALVSRSSSHLQLVEQAPPTTRPPFETAMHSMDCLKQAVSAPRNENAILMPTPDGPHITETAPSHHHSSAAQANILSGFPFPKRTSSVIKQHRILSEGSTPQEMGKFQDPRRVTDLSGSYLGPTTLDRFSNQPASPALSTMSVTSGSESNNSHRVMSLSGIDSNLTRQWPSSRMITPIGSSVAQAAGFATGYFASAQFDGAPQLQRATSIVSAGVPRPRTGRFREGSTDEDALPLLSPSGSPPETSPDQTPRGRKKDSSPVKGTSPAKAKFEHIAEKVGIKVAATSST
ncbi:uncharacterized protein RCC_12101 [Ramularia collo-cygni]|uniref:Uncharacterized protein n=1 Tax=Ramularia collo-cygni TaxID=112498 RepID=A0A2D3UNN2_9PEZI|nr:uncharacterized protein RCC_12101 [Ramularia collo-cygni]CZT15118.1 uncharacterized protein RCC_12101 [Ramularia collo-cygni]